MMRRILEGTLILLGPLTPSTTLVRMRSNWRASIAPSSAPKSVLAGVLGDNEHLGSNESNYRPTSLEVKEALKITKRTKYKVRRTNKTQGNATENDPSPFVNATEVVVETNDAADSTGDVAMVVHMI